MVLPPGSGVSRGLLTTDYAPDGLVCMVGAVMSWAGVEDLLGEVALLVLVALGGDEDEHQREDAEDERLDQVQQELQPVQRDRQDRDREAGDHPERHLAAVDVAEESHGQRDGLDELEEELDEAHEEGDDAGAHAVPELVDREELAEVPADAQLAETLGLEDDEADEREADRHVDVAGRGAQLLDLADRRDQADPVAGHDEDEEAGEPRHVRPGSDRRPARARSSPGIRRPARPRSGGVPG